MRPEVGEVQESAASPGRLATMLEDLSYWPAMGGVIRVCRTRREQVLYLAVGAWNTLFGYLIWAVLQYLLHDYLNYLVVLILAWFPAVLNAYVGYRIIVFRSRGRVLSELPRFSLVYVATLCLNLVLLPLLLRVLPFDIYVTQIVFTVIVVALSYLSHKYFSFRGSKRLASAPRMEGRRGRP
jgi:putative flippase GtrA